MACSNAPRVRASAGGPRAGDVHRGDHTGDLVNDSLLHDFISFGLHGGSLLKGVLTVETRAPALPDRNLVQMRADRCGKLLV